VKVPSDAQARLLSRVAELERDGHDVFWLPEPSGSKAAVFYERIDRDRNRAAFERLWHANREQALVPTVRAVVREGWLDATHERVFANGLPLICVYYGAVQQLDLTEDGKIALGVWRERKMAAPPETVELSDREREVIELADRALALGYVLCAREPARQEARKMRRAGLFDGCWVGHHPSGLVPAAPAVVEVFPDRADRAPAAEGVFV
jgi:hypothetical protein